jgi:hypothetical protein
MLKKLFGSIVVLNSLFVYSQARLVLNNDIHIVIDNSAKIVLENPNPNAVTVAGTGGNIVSENQLDQLIWMIGSTIGNYSIPWTTRPVIQGGNGTKIPMGMNLNVAGNAGGRFVFSTYETATDMNTVYPTYPTAITSMTSPNLGMADGSLYVVDRFWILDNTSYTTIPSAVLSFTYDDAANEIAGSNLLNEANLRAQRWNIDESSWELALFGTTNTTTNVTSSVAAIPADFYPVWILVDLSVPLPVQLSSQDIINRSCSNILSWTTESEQNNSHYEIQRSMDLQTWETLGVVSGNGSTSSANSYVFTDENSYSGTAYYRIKQVDLDGNFSLFEVMSARMNCTSNDQVLVYPNPFEHEIIVKNAAHSTFELIDATGRIVFQTKILETVEHIHFSELASGMYTARISSKETTITQKISKK